MIKIAKILNYVAVVLMLLYLRLVAYLHFRNILRGEQDMPLTTMTIDPTGVRIEHAAATTQLHWPGVDKIARFKGGFAFVIGGLAYYAPDDDLPGGMTVRDILDRVEDWRQADRVFA